MVLEIAQDTRVGRVFSSLAPDTFGLLRFDGSDGINELFEYRVEAVTAMENIEFDDLIGTPMTVVIQSPSLEDIYFNGIITDAQWVGVRENGVQYRFVLRPAVWMASQRRNQRIFHEKSAVEIISEIFSEHGITFSDNTTGTYDTLEYTVQYRESDLSFVRRLMERYGINFCFEHTEQDHELLLIDANPDFPSIGDREYLPNQGAYGKDEYIWALGLKRQLATGEVQVTGFNFKDCGHNMQATETATVEHSNGNIQSFDYPGRHLDQSGAKSEAVVRLKQERVRDGHLTAQGPCESLKSGHRVTLTGAHPTELADGNEYLCLRAHHIYTGENFASGANAIDKEAFQGRYELLPIDTPCVPERKTFDTRIQGPQTAWVVGESGSEIDVDEHGRILVRFHWDLEGANSMRCRVAQMWAGAGWGAIWTPRIGMEVVVIFIEGDPDQPLVTGCVYNGDNPPPYELPSDKNISGIKSDSTLGGGGYNEYIFDDTKGEELIRQHAQKDMHTKVLNCETREVDVDRSTTIGNDETRVVKNDETHTIENDSTWHVQGNEKHDTDGNHDYTILGNETHATQGTRDTEIGSDETLKVRGKTLIDGMSDITIKSLTKITLKVGGQTIVMDNTGIQIKGLMINAKAQATLETQAPMATHKGTGMMTIQGGLVMIN